MGNLQQMLEQRAELDRQIESARKKERADAVNKVRELMAEYGLTAADLAGKSAPRAAKSGGKVAAKYRNAATGESWTGRGLKPKWLQAALASGKQLSDFAV